MTLSHHDEPSINEKQTRRQMADAAAWLTRVHRRGTEHLDNATWRGDYIRLLERFIAVFSHPELLMKYPDDVADDLLFGMQFTLQETIIRSSAPISLRIQAIEACYHLFDSVFRHTDRWPNSCYMFWDNVGIYEHDREEIPREDLSQLQDAIFTCLSNIIKYPSYHCQHSALHGIEHNPDPRNASLLDDFIATSTDEELVRYANILRRDYDPR